MASKVVKREVLRLTMILLLGYDPKIKEALRPVACSLNLPIGLGWNYKTLAL